MSAVVCAKRCRSVLLWHCFLGVIIPMIDLPLPDLELIPEVPERFANLIEQEVVPAARTCSAAGATGRCARRRAD